MRWFCEAGLPEARPGMVGYWRSLACQAWAHAARLGAGSLAGPVHLNLPFREPLVPGEAGTAGRGPESLDGRPGGRPWTQLRGRPTAGDELELPWTERGVVVCGDGDYDALALVDWPMRAGWPVLAEPSSGARRGPNALSAYQYLLATQEFVAAHQPDLIVSAGRPGLSRAQLAFLGAGRPAGTWSSRRDLVAGPIRSGPPPTSRRRSASPGRPARAPSQQPPGWRPGAGRTRRRGAPWTPCSTPATASPSPGWPGISADGLPEGALLWTGSSLPVRDLDCHLSPRADIRVLASRGASGIDGTTSAAIGAALAHGGPAFALIGDLAFLHDAPGLALGPGEPRPDLCLIVVNNDGGGIFSDAGTGGLPRLVRAALRHPARGQAASPRRRLRPALSAARAAGRPEKALPGVGLRIVEARRTAPRARRCEPGCARPPRPRSAR